MLAHMWYIYTMLTHIYTQTIESYTFNLRLVESSDLNPRDRRSIAHIQENSQVFTTASQCRASPGVQDELRVLCTLGFSFLFMVSASLVFWKLTGVISNIGS